MPSTDAPKRSFQSPMTRRQMLARTGAAALAASARTGIGAPSTAPAYPPAKSVSFGPRHHFFGYYDKCPWDTTGRYLLGMEIDFVGRQPKADESLTLGMIDLQDRCRYIPFDKTLAWCWQQGTMLQWLGSAPDREVIYNSVENNTYVSVIRDVHTGRQRTLPCPICTVSRDGTQALSLDFDRVNRLRPGYGYEVLPEQHRNDPAPADAGIYHLDLRTGRHRLVISLRQVAQHKPDKRFKQAEHWFNHLTFSRNAGRFVFLHRWRQPGMKGWYTRLYTANPDGSDLRLLNDTNMVSHYNWRDDRHLLAWTKDEKGQAGFFLIDDQTGEHQPVGRGILTVDGHCSYSPDGQWVLDDTYPNRQSLRTLLLYHPSLNRRVDIGQFFSPPGYRHQAYRCDLHPRWNRDGTQVCIDSFHEKTRQIYVIDVSDIVGKS